MELFPDAANVHHHRVVAVEVFFLPHTLENLLGGDDVALVFAKQPDDVELGRRQADGLVVQRDGVLFLVDAQAVDDADRAALFGVVGGVASQMRFDPGQQLERMERLGDVVVGAGRQAVILSTSSPRAVSIRMG